MPQAEEFTEQLYLLVTTRALRPVIDLLEEDDIGIMMSHDLSDAFRPVPAIEPADALVDVVGEDP